MASLKERKSAQARMNEFDAKTVYSNLFWRTTNIRDGVHCTDLYHIVEHCTILHHKTALYYTTLHSTMHYTPQHCTMHDTVTDTTHCTIQYWYNTTHCTIQYIVLYCTHFTIQYSIIKLYCTLQCTLQYNTTHCTVPLW